MLRNYFKIAWRNTWKHKLWSCINITSLALGIAACLLIFLFIEEERKFDSIHSDYDQIYRLAEVQSFPGTNTQQVALSMPGMGPALVRDYPSIQDFTRYWGRGKKLIVHQNRKLLIEEAVSVDSSFLEIFDFQLVSGDRRHALSEPNAIVLTSKTSARCFGDKDPMGESVMIDDRTYKVTGVVKVPRHSHLQYDALLSMTTTTSEDPEFDTRFGSNYLVTYVKIRPSAEISVLESQMPDFLLKCMPPEEGSVGTVNDYYKLFFQKLSDVHLASMDIEHDYHNHRKFNGVYLKVFTLVGILILLIAAVNFMNLMTARASHRWKEVGVRKTVGARKGQMFTQFSIESGLMGLLAFLMAMIVAWAFAPLLNNILNRDLSLVYFLEHPFWLIGAFLSTAILGFIAGIYPSYYLSSFRTVSILRGGLDGYRKSLFRNFLVVLQFGLAIGMIIGTFVVVQQLYYVMNKDIGLDKDHILLVDLNSEANKTFKALKTELQKSALVKGVTASGQRLGNNFHQWGFKLRADSVHEMTSSNVNVDYDYLDVYDIELLSGRAFSEDRPLDDGYAFIINEALAKELDLEDPIGVRAGHAWYPDDSLGTIIGVVKDFNFNSLHYAINTLALVVHEDWGYDELSIKIDGTNTEAAIAQIERVWNSMVPNWPFQYSFLDQHYEELYQSDQQMKSIVMIMAILAILIASMGLFGLAAITTEKRIKEIGIRKVLGATLADIIFHLSKTFALLILLAFLIFSPITYVLMGKWLENFADRISVQPTVFLGGFVIAFGIAMMTISFHTVKAALHNPVHALRDN